MLTRNLSRLLVAMLAGALALTACGGQPSVPVQPTAAPAPAPTSAPAAAPTAAPTATAPTSAPAPTAAPTSAPAPTAAGADIPTGTQALARGKIAQRPYAVMIDNHPDAYPQTGLDHAAVVFEALAEFGVTRFMAVFVPGAGSDAPKIGPVRSARLYFVQWAMGMHPLYAHAGGSPQGLELAESTDQLVNLDALHNASSAYFARSDERAAPHNLYTSGAELARATKDRGADAYAHDDVGYLFKADAPADQRPAEQRFEYFFIYREDPAGWTYDPKTNGYLRLRRGKPARDADTGAQLWTKNVVVMEVKEAKIAGDEKGRIEQQVVGSGRARVFVDGLEREIAWRKDSAESQLGFYDALGDEVRFNVGPIWIVAVPQLDNLSVG